MYNIIIIIIRLPFTKGDTEFLSLHAVRARSAQKKRSYSVVLDLLNEPKTKIVPKKFVQIQPNA